MKVSAKTRAALLRLFCLPGRLLDLPEGDPRRFIAASVVLYVGLGVILVAWVLR